MNFDLFPAMSSFFFNNCLLCKHNHQFTASYDRLCDSVYTFPSASESQYKKSFRLLITAMDAIKEYHCVDFTTVILKEWDITGTGTTSQKPTKSSFLFLFVT